MVVPGFFSLRGWRVVGRLRRALMVIGAVGLVLGWCGPARAAFVQQGSKLVGNPGSGLTGAGFAVALSDDGDTALVGAPDGTGDGGAFVFVRSGSGWVEQAELEGVGGVGGVGEQVALSGDGNTAMLAGSYASGVEGAWMFTRTGSTWAQQGPVLVGSGDTGSIDAFQGSVALSDDGNTALIGQSDLNGYTGEAFVFTRSGSTWSQQGAPLIGDCTVSCSGPNGTGEVGAGLFGDGVSLSGDGNTALIGAPGDNGPFQNAIGTGAAFVFTRSGSTWSQDGPKLVSTFPFSPGAGQGDGVALSGDGSTAVINAPNDSGGAGAAAVFTNTGGVWAQQAKLVGNSELYGNVIGELSLSTDGNTALVGGTDGAQVFTRSGSTWTQQPVLSGTGAVGDAEQGTSVALSADGLTALVGGPFDNKGVGAAWVFTAGPTLSVSVTGGGSGTVTGSGITCPGTCSETLAAGTAVTLTATPAAGAMFAGWSGACSGTGSCSLTVNSDTAVTATFATLPTLSVALAGDGSGAVTGPGITCPGTCSESLAAGTAVTLTATPAAGAMFAGWSGACSGTGSCSLTVNSDTAVTATFLTPLSCTLKAASRVVLSRPRRSHAHQTVPPAGALSAVATCNKAAAGTVSGVLIEHSGRREHSLRLAPERLSLSAGAATTLTLPLPANALRALERHVWESVKLELVAADPSDTARAQARIRRVIGVR